MKKTTPVSGWMACFLFFLIFATPMGCSKTETAPDSVPKARDIPSELPEKPSDPEKSEASAKPAPSVSPRWDAEDGEWRGPAANESSDVKDAYRVSPQGVGPWTACMSGDDLRKKPGMERCPGLPEMSDLRCYVQRRKGVDRPPLLQLWLERDRLARVTILGRPYRTAEGAGPGEPLAGIRARYRNLQFLQGDEGQWIATSPALGIHFHLADKHAANPDAIDPFTKVTQMEVVFSCDEIP